MPTAVDFAFVVTLLVVGSVFEHFVFWPRFRGIIGQWIFTITALAIWSGYNRSAAALRLTVPTGWRLWVSVALPLVVLALAAFQLRSVARLSAEERVAARPMLGDVAFMLPHSRRDYRWFIALAATAGVCEELLYRGFLVWFFSHWLGVTGAMGLVIVLFGAGHSYQGRKGAIKATLAGAVMSAIVLATGWLVPAMIVHALVDGSSGTVGYWLLREPADTQGGTATLRVGGNSAAPPVLT